VANGQNFGGKASEPETSRPVKKRNFYLPPHAFGAMLGVIPLKFRRDLLHHNKTVSSSAVVLRNCFQDHAFNNFSSTPTTCDGRTNGSDAVSSGGGVFESGGIIGEGSSKARRPQPEAHPGSDNMV